MEAEGEKFILDAHCIPVFAHILFLSQMVLHGRFFSHTSASSVKVGSVRIFSPENGWTVHNFKLYNTR